LNKVFASAAEALSDVSDGASIFCGGFGQVGGNPSDLFKALSEKPVKDLTLIGNAPLLGILFHRATAKTMNVPDSYTDGSALVRNRQVRKLIVSLPAFAIAKMSEPFPIITAFQEGQNIEIEMVPQGTLAERIRAARSGILAFYTPTGAGTYAEKGKEIKEYNGQRYLLEYALTADFGLICAHKADPFGNLVYRGTSRSFNATMAGAARTTIVEVSEIVKLGDIDPEAVVTPGIYVDRIVARGAA
jgi:3-oxoadipate CoA-transferase alpha subunit